MANKNHEITITPTFPLNHSETPTKPPRAPPLINMTSAAAWPKAQTLKMAVKRRQMNNWAIFALSLAITSGLLFATLATGAYQREPLFKPYWEDPQKRQQILTAAAQVGIEVSRGDEGVVILGYRDQIDAPNRQELLAVLNQLIKDAQGYTVYLAPWAVDNATRQYLSLLYTGQLKPEDYLRGVVINATAQSPRVDQAAKLADDIARAYGTYRPGGGPPVAPRPPIYVVIFRYDTTYVVYEPFTPGRDSTYSDWYQWVKTALENLRQGQGRVTP